MGSLLAERRSGPDQRGASALRARRRLQVLFALVCLSIAPVEPGPRFASLGAVATASTDNNISIPDSLISHLGIRYAEPPVGNLRFRAPRALPPGEPVVTKPAACPQLSGVNAALTSEDCLQLNIYAARKPIDGRRPVIVIFPGGGFNEGAIQMPIYDGKLLAQRTGTVVVTVNYRLGVLGFLSHPALDADDPAGRSGNYGFLDQQAALRWVQRHIMTFGGSPHNVTILGQSAGGFSVLNHLVAPGSAGLFHRAIIISTPPAAAGPAVDVSGAQPQGAAVVRAVHCDQALDVASCLRATPIAAFLKLASLLPTSIFVPMPVRDGVDIPVQPMTAIREGRINHAPVMVGTARRDLDLLVAALQLDRSVYPAELRSWFKGFAPEVLHRYPVTDAADAERQFANAMTDGVMFCQNEWLRQALAKRGTVYGFEFTQSPSRQAWSLAPGTRLHDSDPHHGSELPYIFGVDKDGRPLMGEDEKLSRIVMGYVAAFARSGTPHPRGDRRWKHYGSGRSLMMLQRRPEMSGSARLIHHCDFWDRSPIYFPSGTKR
ncbi:MULTISPECIES: carboxylesterase/lipase family protein [unclassified Sphingomonas]|nr:MULTISPECIES: carboxylesterase family protein [unclassified Sphingomonas]